MTIYEKLMHIQQELKVPKNNYNKFGNYKYRSAEDILEAVKPLLFKSKTVLTISDKVINKEGRYYVVSIATLNNVEKEDTEITVMAEAREAEAQKGMSDAQITGSASSYARKYALSGLFAIDDNKDSDSAPVEMDNEIYTEIKTKVKGIKTKAELTEYFGILPIEYQTPEVISLFSNRKKELK
jgi:hypothetical protein